VEKGFRYMKADSGVPMIASCPDYKVRNHTTDQLIFLCSDDVMSHPLADVAGLRMIKTKVHTDGVKFLPAQPILFKGEDEQKATTDFHIAPPSSHIEVWRAIELLEWDVSDSGGNPI